MSGWPRRSPALPRPELPILCASTRKTIWSPLFNVYRQIVQSCLRTSNKVLIPQATRGKRQNVPLRTGGVQWPPNCCLTDCGNRRNLSFLSPRRSPRWQTTIEQQSLSLGHSLRSAERDRMLAGRRRSSCSSSGGCNLRGTHRRWQCLFGPDTRCCDDICHGVTSAVFHRSLPQSKFKHIAVDCWRMAPAVEHGEITWALQYHLLAGTSAEIALPDSLRQKSYPAAGWRLSLFCDA